MTSISHQSDRGSGTTPASCFRTTTETSSGTYSPESSLVRSHKLVWLKLWENSQSPFSSILDLKYYSQLSRGNRKIRSPPYYQLIKHPTTKESNRPSWPGSIIRTQWDLLLILIWQVLEMCLSEVTRSVGGRFPPVPSTAFPAYCA